MNQTDIFNDIKTELEQLLEASSALVPATDLPNAFSIWIAASLLQKAIRRGETDWALTAAAQLLESDPDRFWRRLLVIAYEDIGVADLRLIGQITAAAKFRRQFEKDGLAKTLGLSLTRKLSNSLKCRATDDLYVTIENAPSPAIETLSKYNDLSFPEHLEIILNGEDIERRGIALWMAIGTKRHSINESLPARKGNPRTVFDALLEAGWPHTLIETCRVGYSKTGQIICPFLLLLQSIRSAQCLQPTINENALNNDAFQKGPVLGNFGVPTYAIDYFTREGRKAYHRLLTTDCETTALIKRYVSGAKQIDTLGSLVFRCESGLVDKRFIWPTGNELRQKADRSVARIFGSDCDRVFVAMRGDLAQLNEIRARV